MHAPHMPAMFTAEELAVTTKGRELLKHLAAETQTIQSEAAKEVLGVALQLLFYLGPGRIAWQYMTMEQHDRPRERAMSLAQFQTAGAEKAAAVIKQLVPMLKDAHLKLRMRMPEDIDNYAYDLSLEARAFINATLNKLWTMLLSGLTFYDAPEEGSEAIALLRDVMNLLKMSIELTSKAEALCMAKILWPKLGFGSFLDIASSLAKFYDDLNTQLMLDGLLIQKSSWMGCSAWANDLNNSVTFIASALPQKTHSKHLARVPESMVRLPTERVIANGTYINIPVRAVMDFAEPPQPQPQPQLLLGVSGYQSRIDGTHHAAVHLQPHSRQVRAEVDDSDHVRQHFDYYRERIFSAITTLPADADDWETKQWAKSQKAVKKGSHTLVDIEAASWLIAEEAIKVQENGVSLAQKHDLGLDSHADNGITCSERIGSVIRILLRNKLVCLDVKDHHSILCFVAAPNATFALKESRHKVTNGSCPNQQQSTVVGHGLSADQRALSSRRASSPAGTSTRTPTDGSVPPFPADDSDRSVIGHSPPVERPKRKRATETQVRSASA
ncbi:hypothetical protein LTR85_004646 [Meristemomyces frigidus]|nr:hypothetical protein LTR85_004646 [Meristemomyces frigidus]